MLSQSLENAWITEILVSLSLRVVLLLLILAPLNPGRICYLGKLILRVTNLLILTDLSHEVIAPWIGS